MMMMMMISSKVNIIARLEFELAFKFVAVLIVNHYGTATVAFHTLIQSNTLLSEVFLLS